MKAIASTMLAGLLLAGGARAGDCGVIVTHGVTSYGHNFGHNYNHNATVLIPAVAIIQAIPVLSVAPAPVAPVAPIIPAAAAASARDTHAEALTLLLAEIKAMRAESAAARQQAPPAVPPIPTVPPVGVAAPAGSPPPSDALAGGKFPVLTSDCASCHGDRSSEKGGGVKFFEGGLPKFSDRVLARAVGAVQVGRMPPPDHLPAMTDARRQKAIEELADLSRTMSLAAK